MLALLQIAQHSPKNVLHSTNATQKMPCPISQPTRPGLGLPPQPTLLGQPPCRPKPPPPMCTSSHLRPPHQDRDNHQAQPRSQAQRSSRNEFIRDPSPIGGDYARGHRQFQTDNGWPPEKHQSTLTSHWGSQAIAGMSSQRGNPTPPPQTQ